MLPKTQRLTKPYLKNARSISSTHLLVKYLENTYSPSRFGVIIAKRYVPKSVDRNRIKRQIYRCLRKNKLDQVSCDLVFIVKKPITDIDLCSEVLFLCNKIQGGTT